MNPARSEPPPPGRRPALAASPGTALGARILLLAFLAQAAPACSVPSTKGLPVTNASLKESPGPSTPVELGRVAWRRDHDEAFAEAGRKDKPVLLLFQEIPG